LLDEGSIAFHVAGVLRVAHLLGNIAGSPGRSGRTARLVRAYHWLTADIPGWCSYKVDPGSQVAQGETVAEISDYGGNILSRVTAPADGIVLWRCTHPVVSAGSDLFGVGA
jgi:predicted deacylase